MRSFWIVFAVLALVAVTMAQPARAEVIPPGVVRSELTCLVAVGIWQVISPCYGRI
jgi:hypothetical protein